MLPWLLNQVEAFVGELDTLDHFSDLFLGSNVDECLSQHEQTVAGERARKEAARAAVETARLEKQAEKKRRREAKEQARKAAELKRLKEEVDALFVNKGEFKEGIT